MAYRTTPERVQAIIEVEDGVDLTEFIDGADQLVTDLCINSGYSDDKLMRIETWLAAHLYTVLDQQLKAAKVGTLSVEYPMLVDFGLMASVYGQQAILLDTAGNLARWNNSQKQVRQITVGVKNVGIRHRQPGVWGWGNGLEGCG